MVTGGILLVHDFGVAPHGLTASHVLMGLLALQALVLKILVDHRIIVGRLAYLYPVSLAGLGMQLLFFTESSIMVH
jgi:hypothetical protein